MITIEQGYFGKIRKIVSDDIRYQLIQKYFEEKKFVNSNIQYFNALLTKGLQEVIDENKEAEPTIIPSNSAGRPNATPSTSPIYAVIRTVPTGPHGVRSGDRYRPVV